MKPKELSQHGISSRGRQGCSAIPMSQQCTLGLQGTHCASRAAVPIPSWALQIAGVTATQCSKSSTTPLPRGCVPTSLTGGMSLARLSPAVRASGAPELSFIPMQTQGGKAGSCLLQGVWDGCHPARLSGLPRGLLAVIGGFPWELLGNA